MAKYRYNKKTPRLFLGGALDVEDGQFTDPAAAAGVAQFGAQAINMIDGADGKPSTFGSVASGAMSGASSGAAFGPIGMGVGAIVGGGVSLLAAEKAKKAEEKALQTHMQGVSETARANSKQILRNYATQGVNTQGSYAYGGMVAPQYEVEGNEMVQGNGVMLEGQQQVASDMHKAVGPTHEGGGVNGVGGERVFSDRLKSSTGKTYAKAAESLGRKKGKYEDKLSSNNAAAQFTGERMTARIDEELDNLFNKQEMKKYQSQQTLSPSSSYAYGGNVGGAETKPMLNIYGQPIKRAAPVAPAYLPSNQVTARPAAGVLAGYVPGEDVGINYRPRAYGSSFNNSDIYSEKTSKMLQNNNRFQRPVLAYGGGIDDERPKGSAIVPMGPGWFMDNRSGLPANWHSNANGQYNGAEATQAFSNPANYRRAGETHYNYPTMQAADGSLYAAGNYNPMLDTPMQGRNALGAPGAPSAPTKVTSPVAAYAYKGGGVGGQPQGQEGNGFNGQYLDNFANAIATANTPQIPKPYIDPAVRLNTEFDIRPQLESARRGKDTMVASIDANTVSSGSANANKQKLFASTVENANGLYAQKHNVENQLKNQETMINSRIEQGNNDKRYAYDMASAQRRAGIASDYAQNVGNFQQDLYTAARDKKMDARDVDVMKAISMANPNLATYGSDLGMMKKMFDSDPAAAERMIREGLKQSPNNAALLQVAKERGIKI